MSSRSSLIIREGYPFIIPTALFSVFFAFMGMRWMALLFCVITFFVTWFFRNPERNTPAGDEILVSPADGRILKIEDIEGSPFGEGRRRKISIFMNVFNVHVNRAPCSGKIQSIRYHKGRFLSADLEKASELNEKNAILIRTDSGIDIVTIQIAGLIARRIVCWVKEGMQIRKGERFGLIRFGSRLEVMLPLEAKISVREGDRVKAGETPIGSLI
jgi:phosphatidylserine decarboxylase